MTKKTLTVLLVEDSPEFAGLVQAWLSLKNGTAFVLNWTDSLVAGLDRLTLGGVDVILLDLGLPDSQGLETFNTIRARAPEVPIIILSGDDDAPLALQMVQEGAQDYIVKSACGAELLVKAIQYAVVRYASHAGKTGAATVTDPSRIMGVMGAKGGVGSTTVACSLAVELRRQTGQKTLLADLDVHAGLVGFLMNAGTEYSILDAVSNIHHLDLACWEPMVARGEGEVDILRSPSLPGLGELDGGKVRQVLTLIRAFYRWLVLDLGRLSGLSLSLLDRVDELLLVATTSVPALYETRRTIDGLMKAGLQADRLRLIVNHPAGSPEVSMSELSRIFAIPVYATLPCASQELNDACTLGMLPSGSSDFHQRIARLARKVAGLAEEKPSSRVAQMFTFGRKNRGIGHRAPSGTGA